MFQCVFMFGARCTPTITHDDLHKKEKLMERYVQAFITVLSLMNPAMCRMMFAGSVSSLSPTQRLAGATKAAIAILVILELSALLGVAGAGG